ncbi:MAG TPA: hypothetical protein VL380_00010 [Nitrosospira sp.]|jgi:hypothetical protein|nr:hypothetical protein [Nitrosospira sp.]
MSEFEAWMAPDALGICTRDLGVGAKSTLRGRRLRRAFPDTPHTPASWPAEWREILIGWIKDSSSKRKWDSLLRAAGGRRVHLAYELLDALLRGGWVEVEERRESGNWRPVWISFLESSALRRHLGLADKEALAKMYRAEAMRPLQDVRLANAHLSLMDVSPQPALHRLALLHALDAWLARQSFGTWRDFSLFARGSTKAISTAEWAWLERHLDLVELGIEKHTPALWLRAPVLLFRESVSLDLRLVDDCIALTPATLNSLTHIEGRIGQWRLVENRTSFERAARRYGDKDFVVWLPGFAPSWWKQSVARLLTLCPASALIACDPDPAGIEIASQVGEIWDTARWAWKPWGMDVEDLSRLPTWQPLSENDKERLGRLLQQELPPPASLQALAQWMLIHDKKGEQEGAI